ncbi:MAG TPA: hypothetical protein VF862_01255 [Gemmatimonadales bacterium]
MGEKARVWRAALRNALVWGGAWFALAIGVFAVLAVVGFVPPGIGWMDRIGMAIRVGIVGVLAGAAFATFIRFRYRGRRLSDLSWVRFGLAGGVLTGLLVPAWMQTTNLLSGDGLVPWALIRGDILVSTVFGAVAAGSSLRLAQLAEARLPGGNHDRLKHPDPHRRLGNGP